LDFHPLCAPVTGRVYIEPKAMKVSLTALTRLLVFLMLAILAITPLAAANETELKDDAGKTIIRYVAEVPQTIAPAGTTDPFKQVGLFLCFPEHDRPTGDEILPVRAALQRLGLSDRYVVIGGHPQGRKFGPEDHAPITKLIAWAKKTYPINPRRIYMYGKGEGGKISGEFAMLHPELVTASISYSWGWWKMPSELKEPIDPEKSAPELYMVLGLRDLSHHLTTVRDTYSRVAAKGHHVIYREFEELGARTYHPPSNDDAIAWATRLRNKNIAPSPDEANFLRRYARATAPAEGYFTGLAIVGGAPAGVVLRRLLESDDAAIRAAAARTALHAIFDEATMVALGRKTTDPSPAVRKAALRALAVNANWRSEAAQNALIELATTPSKVLDQTDRVAAVDGLVYATRYQLKGVRQDPPMFVALVSLLGDKDEEVRTMASNVLAPIRDRDFRGDLGRAELKAPVGGWQQWLIDITAKNAGYLKDYEACKAEDVKDAVALYCEGGAHLVGYNLATRKPEPKQPVQAFRLTLQAAEQGYVPAQGAVGMMYAVGKGVQQNFSEAAKWWGKAAEGGHVLAANNVAMLYRGGSGVPANRVLADKWTKFVAEQTAATTIQ
jgi:hypothetical protein